MEAADAEEWAVACQYKMDALSKNDTWELVDLPAGHKAIKSKWVFKLNESGWTLSCSLGGQGVHTDPWHRL